MFCGEALTDKGVGFDRHEICVALQVVPKRDEPQIYMAHGSTAVAQADKAHQAQLGFASATFQFLPLVQVSQVH